MQILIVSTPLKFRVILGSGYGLGASYSACSTLVISCLPDLCYLLWLFLTQSPWDFNIEGPEMKAAYG